MTSLLYYQHLSNLTEDEKIEIDKEVKKNREEVNLFVRELPSNSKLKVKRVFAYAMFAFQLSQSLVSCSYHVVMPLPAVYIKRLSQFFYFCITSPITQVS